MPRIYTRTDVRARGARKFFQIVALRIQPQRVDKLQAGADKSDTMKEAVKEIARHAMPGSFIVANERVSCCNYESLRSLKQYKIISVEQLQKFDPPGKNKLFDNLGNYSFIRGCKVDL